MNKEDLNWKNINYWKLFDNDLNEHYLKRYIKFTESIQNKGERKLDYCEKHHIIPKSFIDNFNIINLTPREHFIAHWILMRCFSGLYKRNMIYAFRLFLSSTSKNKRTYRITSYVYEEARKRRSDYERGRKPSKETREKMSKNHADFSGSKHPMYGKGELLKGNKNGRYGIKMKYMNKDGKNKMVPLNEINKYLESGWVLGIILSEETRKNRSKKLYEFNKAHGGCKGERNPAYGKKLMNNGIINKRIKIEEVNNYLNNGWVLGDKNRKKVTNE